MSSKKILLTVVVVIAAAVIFRLTTGSQSPQQSGSPWGRGGGGAQRVATVPVEDVVFREFRNMPVFTGDIKPMYDMAIVARTTGRVENILKSPGDKVRANELIAVIENSEQQNSVNEARASLNLAQAQLREAENNYEIAKSEFERSQTLFEKEFISQSQFDAAHSQYLSRVSALELAKAQRSQREAALNTSQLRLNYTRLTAPKNGVIGDIDYDQGTIINQGSQLTSVVSIDNVKCEIKIPEHMVSYVERGMDAVVFRENENRQSAKEYNAKVLSVSPIINRQSRTASVEILIENNDHSLKPGMFARVSLVIDSRDSVAGVNQKAITEHENKKGVFGVVGDTAVTFIPVETGFIEDGYVEIIADEIPQKVVIEGLFMLSDGSKIRVAGKENQTEEKKGQNPNREKRQQ